MHRVALLLILGLISACAPYRHIPVAEPMAYVVANNELKRGDYEKATEGFTEFLASSNERTYRPRAYYKLAQAEYALGHYSEALESLATLEQKFPYEHWFAAAVLQGDSNEALGNQTDAVLYWESVWRRAKPDERQLLQTRIVNSIGNATQEEQSELALLLTEPAVQDLLPPGLIVARPPPPSVADVDASAADAEAGTLAADADEDGDESATSNEAAELDATDLGDLAYVEGKRVDAVLFWEIAWSESDATRRERLRPRFDRVAAEANEDDLQTLSQLLTEPEVRDMFTEVRAGGSTTVAQVDDDDGKGDDAQIDPSGVDASSVSAFPAGFRIGCVLPLTGPDRESGRRALSGLRLAFSDAPGALSVRDSGGNAAVAAAVATDLGADQTVLATVGLLSDQTARAVAPVFEDLSLPFLLLNQGRGISGRHLIPAGLTIARPKGPVVTYATQHLAAHRFAVIYPDDAYGRTQRDAFLAEVREQGATIVGTSAYPAGSHDLSAVGDTVRGWMLNGGIEAIFIPDTAAGAAAVAVQIRETDPTIVMLGTERWNDPDTLAASATAVEGAVFSDYFFADSPTPAAQVFASRFPSTGETVPTTLEAQAFDVAMLLRQSIESGAHTRDEVLVSMRATATYEGAGRLRSSPEGIQRDLFLLRVRDGRVEQISAYDG